MKNWRRLDCDRHDERGHVLMGILLLMMILMLLSMSTLYLVGQDVPGITGMREESIAQELTDAAGELAVSWFHDPKMTPSSIAGLLAKRQGDLESGPSFFDTAGRSQFMGTVERPDISLNRANLEDDRILNSSSSGFGNSLLALGRLEQMKFYAPSQPGLLGTLEVTASTVGRRALARTIRFQLGALNIPAIRSAVQTGQPLGAFQPGGQAPVLVHWGDIRVMGDLTINKVDDLIVKEGTAAVTGQTYESMGRLEDRWTDYWIGGTVALLTPPASESPVFPENVHLRQHPAPGLRADHWGYDLLKKTAMQYGTYYRLDRSGRLHQLGESDSDPGLLPSDVLTSGAPGQSHGLVFIDTVDGEVPRPDNLGTLVLDTDYLEALLVVQGHVQLRPTDAGRSVPVLSPSPEGLASLGSRIPVTLSGIHFNGVLYAAGAITIDRPVRLYGAVITAETVIANSQGVPLEVWYNADFSKGYFRGLPVVYRKPGTWQLKY